MRSSYLTLLALMTILAAGCDGFHRVDTAIGDILRASELHHDIHGSSCQPAEGANDRVSHDVGGTYNISTTLETAVVCPVPLTDARPPRTYLVQRKVTTAAIGVADRSTTVEFPCQVWAVDNDGGRWFSTRKFACGLFGGCVTPNVSDTNANTSVDWFEPFGDVYLSDPTIGYFCRVPRRGRATSAVTWTSTGVRPQISYIP